MQHLNTKKAQIFLKVLGSVIKEERLKQNKSQRILADEFDFQKSMLSRIESATNESKIISLCTISESLGIKLSDLIAKVEALLPEDFTLIEK